MEYLVLRCLMIFLQNETNKRNVKKLKSIFFGIKKRLGMNGKIRFELKMEVKKLFIFLLD